MKLLLKDLKPGDEFEYVNTTKSYRQGLFLVLELNSKKDSVLIFNKVTNKTCRHWDQLDVNLISKAKENNMENRMGHFVGWKFGVPVKIFHHGRLVTDYNRLTHESEVSFRAANDGGGEMYYSKSDGYIYELIPHKYSAFSPRYPVCQNSLETAFCNGLGIMPTMGATEDKLKQYPAATLNIDGKTIELSDETVAELKKKLGI